MKKLIKAEVSRLIPFCADYDLWSAEDRERAVKVAPKVQERALKALEDVEKLLRKVNAVVSDVMLEWGPNGEIRIVFFGGPNSMLFSDRYATKYLKRELHEATRATTSVFWVWPTYDLGRKYKVKIELRMTP